VRGFGEGQGGGLVKFSNNLELEMYRYDDECMHDAKC
jgi:hypothetical protein